MNNIGNLAADSLGEFVAASNDDESDNPDDPNFDFG